MAKLNLHFQRFEFKYYLPKNKADKLIPALLNYMEWDPYIRRSDKDYYSVHSLYFDNQVFGCFWDKESGIADRKKLRIRSYGELKQADNIFIEIKRKKDALIVKDRISLENRLDLIPSLDKLLKNKLAQDNENEFLKELILFKKRNSLKPKLYISYDRKALISKMDARFRITFDYNIKTLLSANMDVQKYKLKKVYENGVVLELKYNNALPSWFHHIIQKYQLQRLAYSKYCNALRVVKPEFDDNNYNVK